MPIDFYNYEYLYHRNGKPIFVPTNECRRVANDIRKKVSNAKKFESIYYSLRLGGHIAALHLHRQNRYFCKLDIADFFYSCGRNRVARSLAAIGVSRSEYFARWSCVSNSVTDNAFSLPYGFPQSPILANLVLSRSLLHEFLVKISGEFSVTVYVDDITISCNEKSRLEDVYHDLLDAETNFGFQFNRKKILAPSEALQVFNCDLTSRNCCVSDERSELFFSTHPNPLSVEAFRQYCASVEMGNG